MQTWLPARVQVVQGEQYAEILITGQERLEHILFGPETPILPEEFITVIKGSENVVKMDDDTDRQ